MCCWCKWLFNFIKGITETEDESLAVNDGVLFECHLWKCKGFLNREIDDGELLAAVKNLKKQAAGFFDRVLNEHIICFTITVFLPMYKKLFNHFVIFDSSIVPDG